VVVGADQEDSNATGVNGNQNNHSAVASGAAYVFQISPRPVDVSSRVIVSQTGFLRNHVTGVWSATLTVTNTSGTSITGPIQVVFTNLSANATMSNKTGTFNGSPYLTVSAGPLAAGASVSALIQFTTTNNGFISYTPVTYSGTF
jgi:uncharacterized protein